MFPRLSHALAVGLAASAFLSPARAQNAPAAYQVDTKTSHVYVRVESAGRFGHVHGVQGDLASGSVMLGGAGTLVFATNTFVADTPQARQYVGLDQKFSPSDARKVTANMRGPDVLDVGQHPQATFTIASLTPQDNQSAGEPGKYLAEGSFTLRGVTRPVKFTATVDKTGQAGVLRMTGSFTILQTTYGIQPYSALGGLARVADQLQIWGDVILTPAN